MQTKHPFSEIDNAPANANKVSLFGDKGAYPNYNNNAGEYVTRSQRDTDTLDSTAVLLHVSRILLARPQ